MKNKKFHFIPAYSKTISLSFDKMKEKSFILEFSLSTTLAGFGLKEFKQRDF